MTDLAEMTVQETARPPNGSPPDVRAAALKAYAAGLNVWPPKTDGSKAPDAAEGWKIWQERRISLEQVEAFYRNGRTGLGFFPGPVSSDTEVLDFDEHGIYARFKSRVQEAGLSALLNRIETGYHEVSPHGNHLLWRCPPVGGNTKLAKRPKRPEEMADAGDTAATLIETRGKGGYIIIAPTFGAVNPAGAYQLVSGGVESIVTISPEEREALFTVARTFDEMPRPVFPEPNLRGAAEPSPGWEIRPGDDFCDRANWHDVLELSGWRLEHTRGDEDFWTRPGKTHGWSATTRVVDGKSLLYVFTSSSPLDPNRAYGLFAAYAVLNHNGDFKAAAAQLAEQGYGKRAEAVEVAPCRFPRTDAGNGEYFAYLYGSHLRYDHARKRWLIWRAEQHRWEPDPIDQVRQLAKRAARRRYRDAIKIYEDDLEEREKEAKFAIASEARSRIDAMLVQAASEPPITCAGDGWDADPWLLGVSNGVIDLRTCTLRAGRPEDKITRQVPIAYDPDAAAPRWRSFLDEVFAGSEDMIVFVQTAAGYSLTGLTREQCLMLCIGSGANGKSTLLRTLRMIAGPYGHNMPFTALEPATRNLNDLADLHGKRLVTASESNEAARLNEARVKALTGDDPVTGRQLYERAFEFRPEAKLWLSSNHKPRVADDSHGFWRRIHLVPFAQKFDPHTEPNLEKTLRAEAAGILAWAIRGVSLWLEHGLKPPTSVTEATKTYRQEQDVLQAFIDDACVVVETGAVGAASLYRHYAGWAQREGHGERERMTSTMFGRRMGERFTKTHDRGGWRYIGVGILADSGADVTSSEKNSDLNVTGSGGGSETSPKNTYTRVKVSETGPKPVTDPKPVTQQRPSHTAVQLCVQCQRRELLSVEAPTGVCSPCKNGIGP